MLGSCKGLAGFGREEWEDFIKVIYSEGTNCQISRPVVEHMSAKLAW